MRRYGEEGRRLARLARGIDARKVSADRETKSVSAETTFERDIADFRSLERILWSQAEEVSARLKAKELCRRDRHAEAENRRFQDSHARAFARLARPSSPAKIFAAAREPARARNRRHEIPPARRRRERADHGRGGRSCRSRRRPRGRGRACGRPRACPLRRRRRGQGAGVRRTGEALTAVKGRAWAP